MHRHLFHHRSSTTGIPLMDSLNTLTNTINTFVRFFESINCLFWQIQWLEENITRSGHGTIIIVAIIIAFCVLFMYFGQNDWSNAVFGTDSPILLIIVVGVIALFLWRRFQIRNRMGEMRDGDTRTSGNGSAPVYAPVHIEEGQGVEVIHQGIEVSHLGPSYLGYKPKPKN